MCRAGENVSARAYRRFSDNRTLAWVAAFAAMCLGGRLRGHGELGEDGASAWRAWC
jgi:hypothetical protein